MSTLRYLLQTILLYTIIQLTQQIPNTPGSTSRVYYISTHIGNITVGDPTSDVTIEFSQNEVDRLSIDKAFMSRKTKALVGIVDTFLDDDPTKKRRIYPLKFNDYKLKGTNFPTDLKFDVLPGVNLSHKYRYCAYDISRYSTDSYDTYFFYSMTIKFFNSGNAVTDASDQATYITNNVRLDNPADDDRFCYNPSGGDKPFTTNIGALASPFPDFLKYYDTCGDEEYVEIVKNQRKCRKCDYGFEKDPDNYKSCVPIWEEDAYFESSLVFEDQKDQIIMTLLDHQVTTLDEYNYKSWTEVFFNKDKDTLDHYYLERRQSFEPTLRRRLEGDPCASDSPFFIYAVNKDLPLTTVNAEAEPFILSECPYTDWEDFGLSPLPMLNHAPFNPNWIEAETTNPDVDTVYTYLMHKIYKVQDQVVAVFQYGLDLKQVYNCFEWYGARTNDDQDIKINEDNGVVELSSASKVHFNLFENYNVTMRLFEYELPYPEENSDADDNFEVQMKVDVYLDIEELNSLTIRSYGINNESYYFHISREGSARGADVTEDDYVSPYFSVVVGRNNTDPDENFPMPRINSTAGWKTFEFKTKLQESTFRTTLSVDNGYEFNFLTRYPYEACPEGEYYYTIVTDPFGEPEFTPGLPVWDCDLDGRIEYQPILISYSLFLESDLEADKSLKVRNVRRYWDHESDNQLDNECGFEYARLYEVVDVGIGTIDAKHVLRKEWEKNYMYERFTTNYEHTILAGHSILEDYDSVFKRTGFFFNQANVIPLKPLS